MTRAASGDIGVSACGMWPRAYFTTRSKCTSSSTLLNGGKAAAYANTRIAASAQKQQDQRAVLLPSPVQDRGPRLLF